MFEKLATLRDALAYARQYSQTVEDALRTIAAVSRRVTEAAETGAEWIDKQQQGGLLAAATGQDFEAEAESLLAECRAVPTAAGAGVEGVIPPDVLRALIAGAVEALLAAWRKRRQG